MALDTVQDYVDRCRVLLQDTIVEYRWSDATLVGALNEGIMAARRVRPDLFQDYLGTDLPEYDAASMGTAVDIDPMYRTPFVYYMVGQAQLEDNEENSDARAAALLNKFIQQLRTVDA